jgi:hypothetical protein
MKKFHVFAEGLADRKFLHDYIEVEFGVSLGAIKKSKGGIATVSCMDTTGGWNVLDSNGGSTFRDKMKKNTSNGIVNLVIFDADTATNGGGFSTRKAEIEKWKTDHGLNFELFLFPDNCTDGALENLLERIINSRNEPIFECWKRFEDCLPTKNTCSKQPLTIPAKKSKIYAYMEVLHGESNAEKERIKDAVRDFKNTMHWDLNVAALNPLRDFLHANID